jgi:prepilin-type N-terminal cleavage/methylation domain-containing protein
MEYSSRMNGLHDINDTAPARRRSRRGFTLVELLAVIGIIALIIGFLLVSIGSFRDTARLTECMSNQHQLQLGLVSWSQDNNGKFMSPASQEFPPGISNPNRDLFWVKSYNTGASAPRLRDLNGDGSLEETDQALKDGALYDYVQDVRAYQSPLDPTGRVRSYSLNGFISDIPDNPNGAWGSTVDRISKVRNPANTMYTIAEHDTGWDDNYNRGGWVIDTLHPVGWWKDFPAFWDPQDRLAMSFIDGSSRIIKLANPKLNEIVTAHEIPVNEASEVDFERFKTWLRPDL